MWLDIWISLPPLNDYDINNNISSSCCKQHCLPPSAATAPDAAAHLPCCTSSRVAADDFRAVGYDIKDRARHERYRGFCWRQFALGAASGTMIVPYRLGVERAGMSLAASHYLDPACAPYSSPKQLANYHNEPHEARTLIA
ncbi:hypothetical protein ACOMHN_060970 [Nucella lapillus]